MSKSITLPKYREDGLTKLDTLIKKATDNGPVGVHIRLSESDTVLVGHIHHMDKFTLLFVGPEGVLIVHKHAIVWIKILDPIGCGLAELAADKAQQ